MTRDQDSNDERFDRALREWAARPPATPAPAAAARIAARIPERAAGGGVWRFAAAAALVVIVLVGLSLFGSRGARPRQTAHVNASPPLGDDVVVQWLDPDTPVYFVLPSDDRLKGGIS